MYYLRTVSEKINQRAKEGFTPISDLNGKEKVHVLAVCVREPWKVGRTMWKTLFKDPSGQVVGMKRNTEFGFKLNDVVAAYSAHVGDFKGDPELEFRHFTDTVVNPDTAEASKLKEWYQNQGERDEHEHVLELHYKVCSYSELMNHLRNQFHRWTTRLSPRLPT